MYLKYSVTYIHDIKIKSLPNDGKNDVCLFFLLKQNNKLEFELILREL